MQKPGNINTALVLYAKCGQMDDLRRVLGKGAEIDSADLDGCTGLMHSSYRGHIEVVRLLLEYGADPHFQDGEGHVALDYAQDQGRTEIAAMLAEAQRRPPPPPRYNINTILQEPSYLTALGMLRVQVTRPRVQLSFFEEIFLYVKNINEDVYAIGFGSFFKKHDHRQVAIAIQGLEMIGAVKTLGLMQQALTIFDQSHFPEDSSLVAQRTEARREFLDELSDQYREQDEDLYKLLYGFICKQRHEFRCNK